ncbi:hypothetical protein K7B09_12495 [Thermomonas sp. RSS23]|uniref:Uncharacterized protein n=1 Tax=Thermomonas beijingensis TaxID=2872701 RepID=A0ABS7THC9_9GAMM|nr:hypothetical protein [Thermomonas beijingensis]MBZ4187140.1 hypothetical protein [Thermomonas beijingensis]
MAVATRTRESNIWIFIGLLLTTMRFVDYFFYGKHVYDLIAGTGFVLVTIGAYLNGFQTLEAITNSGKKSVVNGYAFALIGMGLAIAAMVVKYMA